MSHFRMGYRARERESECGRGGCMYVYVCGNSARVKAGVGVGPWAGGQGEWVGCRAERGGTGWAECQGCS